MRSTIFSVALLSWLGSLQVTLARPTNSTSPTNTTLQARPTASIITAPNSTAHGSEHGSSKFGAHYGWAGFFESKTCEGSPIGNRPKFNDQACRPVTPTADNLGISWGSSLLGLSSLTLYEDDACKQEVADLSRSKLPGDLGPGSCVPISQYGGRIGSIQSNG